MDLAIAATAFGTIFLAELPDKTMLATIVMSARSRRPLAVWCGAAAALVSQMAIAAAAGRLLSLLPQRLVLVIVAAMFAIGATMLWRESRNDDGDDEVAGADRAAAAANPVRLAATVFGIVFLAEWGDLTQLSTASLASNGDALSVFAGASLAMILVAGLGALVGRQVLRVLPPKVLQGGAAVLFAGLAVFFVIRAITLVELDGSLDLA